MRQVKKGLSFYPTINTGDFADKDNLSMKVVDIDNNDIANDGAGTFDNLVKAIEAHKGSTAGVAHAGDQTINLDSGNELVAGDVFVTGGHGYRVTAASDTSIDINRALLSDINSGTDINNTGDLSSYEAECIVNTAGVMNVVISHPEMDDTIIKYEVVEKTTAELISEVSAGRKLVAVV